MINTEIVLWAPPLRFWHGATRGLNPALAMLMQTKKSLEKDSNSTFEISEQRIGPIYYIYKY